MNSKSSYIDIVFVLLLMPLQNNINLSGLSAISLIIFSSVFLRAILIVICTTLSLHCWLRLINLWHWWMTHMCFPPSNHLTWVLVGVAANPWEESILLVKVVLVIDADSDGEFCDSPNPFLYYLFSTWNFFATSSMITDFFRRYELTLLVEWFPYY